MRALTALLRGITRSAISPTTPRPATCAFRAGNGGREATSRGTLSAGLTETGGMADKRGGRIVTASEVVQ